MVLFSFICFTFNKNSSIFDSLITNKNDSDIPDNINTIFLNYILIINMIKKELHYIITIYKSLLIKLNEKFNILNKLKESLSIKDNVNTIKKEELIDYEDHIEVEEDFSIY